MATKFLNKVYVNVQDNGEICHYILANYSDIVGSMKCVENAEDIDVRELKRFLDKGKKSFVQRSLDDLVAENFFYKNGKIKKPNETVIVKYKVGLSLPVIGKINDEVVQIIKADSKNKKLSSAGVYGPFKLDGVLLSRYYSNGMKAVLRSDIDTGRSLTDRIIIPFLKPYIQQLLHTAKHKIEKEFGYEQRSLELVYS